MKPVWLILFSGFAVLSAQQLPVQVSAGVGYATFIDESDQSHATFGGSARFYFTRRNAIEPEVLYLYRDASDKDIFAAARAAQAVILTKDRDFVDMAMILGTPPQVIWLTCGNTSNENLDNMQKPSMVI